MRVKIGDTIYDSDNEIIAIQFSDRDKLQIMHMPVDNDVYVRFPETFDKDDFDKIESWVLDLSVKK